MYREKTVSAVICAAGQGSRMNSSVPKQFLLLGGKPMITMSLEKFLKTKVVDEILLVLSKEYVLKYREELKAFPNVKVVEGGKTRQESVYRGIKNSRGEMILIHDGARPYVSENLIFQIIEKTWETGAVIPIVKVKDTIKKIDETGIKTMNREQLYHVQTPQGFWRNIIEEAHEKAVKQGFKGTDDSSLVENIGKSVHAVKGEYGNIKITTPEDLSNEDRHKNHLGGNMNDMRIGSGFDVHRLVKGRKLILGGIEIPFDKGLLGHSDADCVLHALTDALLGALALGDIGKHFPDTDIEFKDIDSRILLKKAYEIVKAKGYRLANCDITIACQAPKLAAYIPLMREAVANTLETDIENISIKATTTEHLGYVGRGEGISARASALLMK